MQRHINPQDDKYLRQAFMDAFDPQDDVLSLEQLKVAVIGAFREAKAKCLKEAWNGTFNLPLKGNSNHLFFILSLLIRALFNSWLSLFILLSYFIRQN
jgi:hypothetical protein